MSKLKIIVASAFTLSPLLSVAAWSNDAVEAPKGGQCEVRVVKAQTHFPQVAQDRGEGGTVRVRVILNKDGRVETTRIMDSSGSELLDKAAAKSVSTDWRFDVSHCVAGSLPATHDVSVEYRRVPKAFSASVNHRGMKFAKEAAASDQCTVVPIDSGSHVISCIQRTTLGGVVASDVAQRDPR